MIVVSNTSPLTNLAAIGQFDVLSALYHEIHIANAVWDGLNAGGQRWPGRDEAADADWVHRHSVGNRHLVTGLTSDLDLGEAESIGLSLELGADLVLLDEKEGRHHAQRLGLKVLGVVGILLASKARQTISEVRPHLDALREVASFRLSGSLYQKALDLAGEAERH